MLRLFRSALLNSIKNNFGLKFIAFVVSITIWLWVQTRQTAQVRTRSNITYRTTEQMVVLNQPTKLVTITVEAPKGLLRLLEPQTVDMHIDLRQQLSANRLVAEFNSKDIINLPEGIKVLQFSPPSVNIELDEVFEQTLGIELLNTVNRELPAMSTQIM